MNFLDLAMYPAVKETYFGDKPEFELKDLPQPLTMLELDINFFNDLPNNQKELIFSDVNATKYFGLDVLDSMKKNMEG